MKTSELIALLQGELEAFGDKNIIVYCPKHSGEDGDPVGVHGLGWFSDMNGKASTFIECCECHDEDLREKIESEVLDELFPHEDDAVGEEF